MGKLAFRYVGAERGNLRGTVARGKRVTRDAMRKRQGKEKGGD